MSLDLLVSEFKSWNKFWSDVRTQQGKLRHLITCVFRLYHKMLLNEIIPIRLKIEFAESPQHLYFKLEHCCKHLINNDIKRMNKNIVQQVRKLKTEKEPEKQRGVLKEKRAYVIESIYCDM